MAETIPTSDSRVNQQQVPLKSSSSETQLDHIIILLSPKDFNNVPKWLSSNFTIIEGGTHSKGTSHNKLIIFKDGTYLELFSWTDPQPEGVEPHADFPSWADKPEGCVIDWALTGGGPDSTSVHRQVSGALRDLEGKGETVDFVYHAPTSGGRRRTDGTELKWATIRPYPVDDGSNRSMSIDVPFFCHDVTSRILRVPNRSEDITTHPCGATGVAGLVIEVAPPHLGRCAKLYEAILGGADKDYTPVDRREGAAIFKIGVPDPSNLSVTGDENHISQQQQQKQKCNVHLQIPDEDHRFSISLPGTSVRRLVLFTDLIDRRGEQLDQDDFGTRINLC